MSTVIHHGVYCLIVRETQFGENVVRWQAKEQVIQQEKVQSMSKIFIDE